MVKNFKSGIMMMLVLLLTVFLAACGSGSNEGAAGETTSGGAEASNYPEKPVTFIAPSGAGGAFDTALRSVTKTLSDTGLVEQQMTVEPKPGGGGTVFMSEYATQDTKDDYKLFLSSPTLLINNLKKEANTPYGYKDTTPIAALFQDYGVIAVGADSEFDDLQSLFEHMKANPSEVSVAGGSAPGALDHLTFLIPANEYGLDAAKVKYIPYDGKSESMTALLGGNADALASVASSVSEFLEAGKIKVLAVDAPERLPAPFEDVPTLKESGIDAEFAIWRGIFGPKEMTPEAKEFWSTKLEEMAETEEWQAELEAKGWEPFYKNSEEFEQLLADQEQRITDALKSMGMANE